MQGMGSILENLRRLLIKIRTKTHILRMQYLEGYFVSFLNIVEDQDK